jgi:hypothetical protein
MGGKDEAKMPGSVADLVDFWVYEVQLNQASSLFSLTQTLEWRVAMGSARRSEQNQAQQRTSQEVTRMYGTWRRLFQNVRLVRGFRGSWVPRGDWLERVGWEDWKCPNRLRPSRGQDWLAPRQYILQLPIPLVDVSPAQRRTD